MLALYYTDSIHYYHIWTYDPRFYSLGELHASPILQEASHQELIQARMEQLPLLIQARRGLAFQTIKDENEKRKRDLTERGE